MIAGALFPDSRCPVTEAGTAGGIPPTEKLWIPAERPAKSAAGEPGPGTGRTAAGSGAAVPSGRKTAHRLSGGETARMALARLFMGRYDLVILDEPTASMDMESTMLTEQLTRSMCPKRAVLCCWSPTVSSRPGGWPITPCISIRGSCWSKAPLKRFSTNHNVLRPGNFSHLRFITHKSFTRFFSKNRGVQRQSLWSRLARREIPQHPKRHPQMAQSPAKGQRPRCHPETGEHRGRFSI